MPRRDSVCRVENGFNSSAKMQPVRCTVCKEKKESVEALWFASMREADLSRDISSTSLSPNPSNVLTKLIRDTQQCMGTNAKGCAHSDFSPFVSLEISREPCPPEVPWLPEKGAQSVPFSLTCDTGTMPKSPRNHLNLSRMRMRRPLLPTRSV